MKRTDRFPPRSDPTNLSEPELLAQLIAELDVASALNAPMSVVLTLGLVETLTAPGGISAAHSPDHPAPQRVTRFFGALGWLAQIALFLMLGPLATPHEPPPVILPALAVPAMLIRLARPAGVLSLRAHPRSASLACKSCFA